MSYCDAYYETDDGLKWEEHNAVPPHIGERVDVENEDGTESAVYRVVDVGRLADRAEIATGVAKSMAIFVSLKREWPPGVAP